MPPAAERLRIPDLLGALIVELGDRLPVPVVNQVPNPRPEAFVRLDLIGGPGRLSRVTSRHTITVEAWAQTNPTAFDLATETNAHLHELGASHVGTVLIYSVNDVAAPGTLPDPDSSQARMVASVEVTCRLAAD